MKRGSGDFPQKKSEKMRSYKVVFWYIGVATTTGLLLLSIAFQTFQAGVVAFFLALILARKNDQVPLPSFFASRLKQAKEKPGTGR
jgi:hypothetical protein